MDKEIGENGMRIGKILEKDNYLHEFSFTNIIDNFEKVELEFG